MNTCEDCKYTTCDVLHGSYTTQCQLQASGSHEAHLCDACMKVVEVENRMVQLHSELVELARKRLGLKFLANKRHDLLFQHMPPEIASHIFSLYVDDLRNSLPFYERCNWGPPVLIASICKTWRNIALSTPQLWASPRILLHSRVQSLSEMANICLPRSGVVPLRVTLYVPGCHEYGEEQMEFDPLFDVLGGQINHLHTLTLSCVPQKLVQRLLQKLKSFPALQGLRILGDSEEDFVGPHLTFSLQDTRLLNEMELSMVPLKQHQMPWGNLTFFTADELSVDECLEVLRRCQWLVTCKFTDTLKDGNHFSLPSSPITHLSLREVYFEPADEDATISFMNAVNLPNLVGLTYSAATRFVLPTDAFLSLFERSNCQLIGFTIAERPSYMPSQANDDRFLPLLEKLPTLRQLELCGTQDSSKFMTDKFLRRLAVTDSSESDAENPILPSLTTLTYSGPLSFSWGNLVELFPHLAPCSGPYDNIGQPRAYRCYLRQINIKFLKSKDMPYIDNAVIPRLSFIKESGGVSWNILSHDGKDMLQASLKRFYQAKHN